MKNSKLFISVILFCIGCSQTSESQNEVQAFLDTYTAEFKNLQYVAAEAEWRSNTMIIEGDDTNTKATRKANEDLAAFTGSVDNINATREYLKNKDMLTGLQIKQLELILQEAANNPQTVPELVKERIKVEAEAVEKLFGFDFKIDGRSVSTNEIDETLRNETDLEKGIQQRSRKNS